MSEKSKAAFLAIASGNGSRAFEHAHQVVVAYAGSENANPDVIPRLLANLVELITSGELPAPTAPRTQGQTGY